MYPTRHEQCAAVLVSVVTATPAIPTTATPHFTG